MLLLLGSTWAVAQTATSTIFGQVVDQQGAAIVGAKITLTNLATGVVRHEETDSTGNYRVTALPPGAYKVTAEMTGFRTLANDKIDLPVNTATKLNFTLQVGAASETVEVSEKGVLLNTSDASVGNPFGEQQIKQLPLEGRNVVGLLSLQPGAVFVPTTGYTDNRQGSISGGHGDQTNVTMDGVDVNDPVWGYAYTSVLRATLDSTQEFRVTTTNYGAEQGRSSSAQVSLITKSGSNAFHGSAYWYHRNTAFSSNEYFNKNSQLWSYYNENSPTYHQPTPDCINKSNKVQCAPVLQKHIWGFSVGGPVLKDRLFFFANMENLRQKSQSSVERAVPSASFRDGILIYGCAEGEICPGGSVTGLSGASHAIPAGYYGLGPAALATLDPLGVGPNLAASKYFNQYPLPNATGRDGFNFAGYRWAAPTTNNQYTYITRLDFKIDPAGNHALTWRGNLQNDRANNTPYFPGQQPQSKTLGNSRGLMAGYTAVLSSHFVNTFRYGYTRIGGGTAGQIKGPYADFRFFDDYDPQTGTSTRQVPTHNFVDDLSWNHGNHTMQFGTNIRFIRVMTSNNSDVWPYGNTNGSWVPDNGTTYMPVDPCPTPGVGCFPAVSEGTSANFADGWVDILGILSQNGATYHYDKTGALLPFGQPIKRKYATNSYEFYWQDNWRLKRNLNFVYGLRWSLNTPPWEVNGEQVGPTTNMSQWFAKRAADALAGVPSNKTPLISFDLAGAANGKPPMYPYDKNNFAPRVGFTYSPDFTGWMSKLTGGPGKTVFRGGYGMVYDAIGLALANRIDRYAAFGMSSDLSTPWAFFSEGDAIARYQSTTYIPPLPPAPPGGFPATPPTESGAITSGVDNTLTTPYSHTFNFMIARELPRNMTLEVGYVGRRGRDLEVRRDLAMPLNYKDPKSGMDYYTATKLLIQSYASIPSTAAASAYTSLPNIPYFENVFAPGTAGGVPLTATQYMARRFNRSRGDYTTALYSPDEYCSPDCPVGGAFTFFNQQWDSLGAISTLGKSEYHALQASLRKKYSDGVQFDLNYTLSKSNDMSSAVERGSFFTEYGAGGYSGFLINSWDPRTSWGRSDFDVRHQINLNWIADLPFGRGMRWGAGSPGWLNAIAGGWQFSGIYRWSSGFPLSIVNCRSCWATNWNLQGNAMAKTPGVYPATGTYQHVVGDVTQGPLLPGLWKDPAAAYTDYFRLDYPGEGGIRNYLNGNGYFTIDVGIGKTWSMPYQESHKLKFRWEIFNLTNSARFDVGTAAMTPDQLGTFGSYSSVLSGCDNAAGRCMQVSFRYEF